MVLVGKLNSEIVQRLNRAGQPAVGLAGEDGTLFEVAPAPNADQVGFVGSVERVDVDVLNHIAADYIPVIASSASDRDGQSYNVNADEAAGKVAAALGAHKAIFLTDVEGWLADAGDEGSLISRATVGEVEETLRGDRRRDAAEAAGLRRRDPRRRPVGPHHRRPQAPQPPARALHRRRHRHDGDAVMSLAGRVAGARGALPDADLQARRRSTSSAARARCSGTPTARSTSTSSPGSRSARSATATRPWSRRCSEQAARLMHVSNLFYTEPMARLAAAALGVEPRRPRLLRQLRHRGQRVRDQGRPQARPRPRHRGAGDRQLRGRLPRPQLRRPLGDARRSPATRRWGRCCPASARCPATTPRRCARRSATNTAAVLIEPIQGEAGVQPISDEALLAAREACDEAGALLILDEIQTGVGRTGSLWAYEQTPVRPDVITSAKALGGGFPIGACITGPAAADVLEPGDHGSTFAGGPVATAAALAVLDVVDDPALLRRVRELGARAARGPRGARRRRARCAAAA